MQILSTKNYGKFSTIYANRQVSEPHVRAIARSIEKHNMLDANPIIVNEKFEIIDGQHRLKAAESLGIDIYYVVSHNASLLDIASIQIQQAWTTDNWAQSWDRQGNLEYTALIQFAKDHELSIANATEILSGESSVKNPAKLVRSGEFTVMSMDHALRVLDYIESLKPYLGATVAHHRYFIRSVKKILNMPDAIGKEILEKIPMYPKAITRQEYVSQYMRVFEDIYNYRKKEEGRKRF